ncbi:MAG: hypothetical protein ACRDB9_00930 [Cetobacterium sp.]
MKKLITSFLLTASIISTVSVSAFAWQQSIPHNGGTLTYGVVQPGNGYEMGYSYYYHTSPHIAVVYYNYYGIPSTRALGYTTAKINGDSIQTSDNTSFDFDGYTVS